MMEQYLGAIIGGLIGFVSSVGTLFATRLFDRFGKVKIYCKRVGSSDHYWGFWGNEDYMTFLLPMDFELVNTSNRAVLLRDLSVGLFLKGRPLVRMRQGEGTVHSKTVNGVIESDEKIMFGGDNGSYSFVLQPRSIQKQKCFFFLNANKAGMEALQFDEIRLSYFDEKDRHRCYPIAHFEGDWKFSEMDPDRDWIKVK